jgi:hypothetical protein
MHQTGLDDEAIPACAHESPGVTEVDQCRGRISDDGIVVEASLLAASS